MSGYLSPSAQSSRVAGSDTAGYSSYGSGDHVEMRDDERYPTVIGAPVTGHPVETGHSPPPEVAPYQHSLDPDGHDKIKESSKGSPPPLLVKEVEPPPRTCCGLRRRTFFIIVAVVALLVVGAVVGGVVGGLKASNNSSDSDSGDSDNDHKPPSSATPTSSNSEPLQTQPINAFRRSIAAGSSNNADGTDLQLFYQDLDSTAIWYRRIRDDEASNQQKLDLDIEPNWATPLAAATVDASDTVSVMLFYFTPAEDQPANGFMDIAQATLECSTDSDSSSSSDGGCEVKSNSIISEKVTNDITWHSKLAAMRPDEKTVRVFFQGSDGHISSLNGDHADSTGWTMKHIVGSTSKSTGIVAMGRNTSDMNVFYVSSTTNQWMQIHYDDAEDTEDADITPVDDNPGHNWDVNVSLAGARLPFATQPFRLYFADPRGGEIVSYYQDKEDPDFKVNHDDNWGKVTGGLTAAAWEGNIRLYYFQGSQLVTSALHGTNWDSVSPL